MAVHQEILSLRAGRKGTREITDEVARVVGASGFGCGVATVFCRHTSCSLVIMENADPSARRDLEAWFDRLVPERDPLFEHTLEGPDDMPSHIWLNDFTPIRDAASIRGNGENNPAPEGILLRPIF
jgi:secondary thiamine-phosphate synthase enzyme